ncbi:hypothetical protein J4219_06075 [Candidatus Woesearchaeota archaeon]|nr:hypothetical protein [Candidatus Woesearchaeota archaeon]
MIPFLQNKKGMEFAVGFIVMLILTIVVFGIAISLLFKWFGQAEELQAEIDKKTQEQILAALRTGNQLVVIPFSIQETTRGNPVSFGIGVRNVGSEGQFSMALSYSGAYAPDGSTIAVDPAYVATNWLGNFNVVDTFTLKRNQQDVKPVLLRADVNVANGRPTPKGDYVFNLCVYNKPLRADGTAEAPCEIGQFRTNPAVFYTGKIYQITLRVA